MTHYIDYDHTTPEDRAELDRQKSAYERLHKAAPYLLAACKAIVALADGQGRANLLEVAGQARAAIAKVEEGGMTS